MRHSGRLLLLAVLLGACLSLTMLSLASAEAPQGELGAQGPIMSPVSMVDTYTVAPDTELIVPAPGVLGNDIGSAPLTAEIVTLPAHGSVSLDPAGGFTYTPEPSFVGTATFQYRAYDGYAYSQPTTVTIKVTSVPDPGTVPVTQVDTYTTEPSTLLIIPAPGVLGNDFDPSFLPLTAEIVEWPTAGFVTLDPNGGFTYTAPSSDCTDTFKYRAFNGVSYSQPTTVTVRVTATPEPGRVPMSAPDTYTIAVDAPLSIAAPGVLANDWDPSFRPLTAELVEGPAHGTLMLAPDGGFEYTPTASFEGTDTFKYRATAGADSSQPATVTIRVGIPEAGGDNIPGEPLPPGSVENWLNETSDTDDVFRIDLEAGQTLNLTLYGDVGTDFDIYLFPPSCTDVSERGRADVWSTSWQWGYPKSINYPVPATGTYYIDLHAPLGSGSGGYWLSWWAAPAPVNNPPVAGNDSYVCAQDTLLVKDQMNGVLTNDWDMDWPTTLTAMLQTGPSNGSLTLFPDGSFTYTPDTGFTGADTFTYCASDGLALSSPAVVTIEVRAPGQPPVATADEYTVAYADTVLVDAPGVLANDSDPENDPMQAVLVTPTTYGSVWLNLDGSFTYWPWGFVGTDSFTYRVYDGLNYSEPVQVTINVLPLPNRPPVATDRYYYGAQDTALTVTVWEGLSLGCWDDDYDSLTFTLDSGPANGTVEIALDGSFVYTPNAGFNGEDSFTYCAFDGEAYSAPAIVTVNVLRPNLPPTPADDTYTVDAWGRIDVPAPGVLANDTDPESDSLSVVAYYQPTGGWVYMSADGSFSYWTWLAGGTDTFTYMAFDGRDWTAGTVTINILPPNQPPTASADEYTLEGDTEFTVAAPGVLANDSDPEGQPLTAQLAWGPSNGTIALDGAGGFTYTPDTGFVGTDSFAYYAFDGQTWSYPTYVTLNVYAPLVTTRYENKDPLLDYTGRWVSAPLRSCSGGSASFTGQTGGTVTLTFSGTAIDWIATKGSQYGKARVSLDGEPVETINLYSATPSYQQIVYSKSDLAYGVHTLTIECAGVKGGPRNSGTQVNVDAFDIHGVLLSAAP